jgi:hypothetical protein
MHDLHIEIDGMKFYVFIKNIDDIKKKELDINT